jgi:hypothetical protein
VAAQIQRRTLSGAVSKKNTCGPKKTDLRFIVGMTPSPWQIASQPTAEFHAAREIIQQAAQTLATQHCSTPARHASRMINWLSRPCMVALFLETISSAWLARHGISARLPHAISPELGQRILDLRYPQSRFSSASRVAKVSVQLNGVRSPPGHLSAA